MKFGLATMACLLPACAIKLSVDGLVDRQRGIEENDTLRVMAVNDVMRCVASEENFALELH